MGKRRLTRRSAKLYLVNPSDKSFGIGVITPGGLYVLAAATPSRFGDPVIADETLEQLDVGCIAAGDIVGIGIHMANTGMAIDSARV